MTPKKLQNFSKFFKGWFFGEILTFGCYKKIWEATQKIWLCSLVVSVCAKFEDCAAKTVGGVGFLRVRFLLLKKHYCQILPHGCQFEGTDFKLD